MGRKDEIRTIAYRIWEEEGRDDGHAVDHWLKAEAIWEDEQKDEIFVVTKPKSKQNLKKDRSISSPDPDSMPENTHGIHRSLILKVLGE